MYLHAKLRVDQATDALDKAPSHSLTCLACLATSALSKNPQPRKATELVDPARRYWHLRKVFPGAKGPMRIWLWRFGSQLNLCLKPIEADMMERAQVATDVLSK